MSTLEKLVSQRLTSDSLTGKYQLVYPKAYAEYAAIRAVLMKTALRLRAVLSHPIGCICADCELITDILEGKYIR